MARVRRPRLALAATLAALVLAGCGPFGGRSEKEKAGDTVTDLVAARNRHDWTTVCDLISSDLLARFKQARTTCEKALPRLAQRGTTTTIRIEQVRVSGERATVDATVSRTGGAGRAQTILLVKEDGDWKVSQVGF